MIYRVRFFLDVVCAVAVCVHRRTTTRGLSGNKFYMLIIMCAGWGVKRYSALYRPCTACNELLVLLVCSATKSRAFTSPWE